MKKIILLIALLVSIVYAEAQGGGFKTFSLKQAVEYAVQNNIAAKNAKLNEEEAKARNNEIISMGLPQISANFDYTSYIVRPTSPAIAKIFNDPNSLTNKVYGHLAQSDQALADIINNYSAAHKNDKLYFVLPNGVNTGVQLNQLVFDGRYFVGLKATKELLKASQLSTQLSEQDIRYNVIKAYYDCQTAKEIRTTLDSNLVIIQKLLHDTRETYKQGLIEELDVNRLELAESNLKSQINNVENLYKLSLSNLKFNMGLQMTEKIALTENIEDLRTRIAPDASKGFDASQRIETQLLETSILLRNYDVQQKQSGYYPNIYAFANFGGGSQVDKVGDFFKKSDDGYGGKISNWYMQSFVGFSLKVPIWDGGQKHANIKQAKIEVLKAKNDLENFKNAAALQVEAAQTTLASNLIEENNAKQSKALNEKIFGKTKTKFNEGVGSSFELFLSQQDLITNEIRYINALKSVLAAKADLDKALGVK